MNKPQNWVRALILVLVIAWPTYEYKRYRDAKAQQTASEALWKSVEAKLAEAKIKYAAASSNDDTQVR